MHFLALSYSIPANPSRYRVAVWKALKELGAVYLQPAVAIVPEREGMREALAAIKERVIASGGTAALLTLAYLEEADEREMLAAIQHTRTEEYGEIEADARRQLAQLEWEEGQKEGADPGRYALECRRLRRRLEIAQTHDFFDAPGKEAAAAAIEALAARLPAGQTEPPARRSAARPKSPAPMPSKAAVPSEETIPTPPAAPEPAEETQEKHAPRGDMPVFLF